jgi:hypothetical protein
LEFLQTVTVRRDAGERAKRIREVALIGETTGHGDFGDTQVPTRQESLCVSNTDLPDISADRTAEDRTGYRKFSWNSPTQMRVSESTPHIDDEAREMFPVIERGNPAIR